MALTLHLGVYDIPYADKNGLTTGEVAQYLEDKYHPMEVFYELHKDQIAEGLAENMQGALESMLMGAPPSVVAKSAQGGLTKVDNLFKKFLSNREMEGLGIPGVPTQAALDGVNHRLKKKRGRRRPSFIDTGQYQASFHATVDGETS